MLTFSMCRPSNVSYDIGELKAHQAEPQMVEILKIKEISIRGCYYVGFYSYILVKSISLHCVESFVCVNI